MLPIWLYALASVSMVSLLSLAGVFAIPVSKRTIDKIVFYLVALATGAMLGNAVVHLLPESFEHSSSPVLTSTLVLVGFLFSFVLEKVLKIHCHHASGHHAGGCDDDHDEKAGGHIHHTGWMALVSHGMDNFTDGILIAVSYMVSIPAGIATTVAIVLHEIPMEFGNFGVLINAGFSRKGAIGVNFCSALVATLGTVLTLTLGSEIQGLSAWLAPAAAGIVLYITAAGLIPQMQREQDPRRSLVQFLIMMVGIAVMIAVKFLD